MGKIKKCTICEKELPKTKKYFYINVRGYFISPCKKCYKERQKTYNIKTIRKIGKKQFILNHRKSINEYRERQK